MEGLSILPIVSGVLLIVASLYLGFWGLFNIDVGGDFDGGHESVILRIIVVLFGLAALYEAMGWKASQRRWWGHLPQRA